MTLVLILGFGLLTASAASAQSFESGVELVTFGVTVVDKQGNFVTDLRPEDFEIVEEGQRQRLQYFIRGGGREFFLRPEGLDTFVDMTAMADDSDEVVGGRERVPLHLGLVFDTSGSMAEDLRMTRTAAIKFLNVLMQAEDITLVDFDTEVRVARYGQNDFPRLVERIRGRDADGYTALYDALGVYLDGAAGQTGQKVLVLYTDGGDTRSAINFGELMNLLKASDVTLFAIGFLQHTGSASLDLRMKLQQIADVTGGIALFPASLKQLDQKYDEILAELASRYTVGYVPSDPATDGRWRDVKIKVTRADARQLRVRVRRGYFSTYVAPAPEFHER